MKYTALFILIISLVSGCSQIAIEEPICSCDGVQKAKASFGSESFSINGQAKITAISKKDKLNESYNIRLYFEKPSNIYIQLDHILLPKAIIAGGNNEKYWVKINHKEFNRLWVKDWNNGCGSDKLEGLILSPSIILESLGLVDCSEYQAEYYTANGYLVAEQIDTDGIVRKVYTNCCSSCVELIEYYNDNKLLLNCKINEYAKKDGEYLIPTEIIYSSIAKDYSASVIIKFSPASLKAKEFNDSFRKRFFNVPN